MFAEHYSRAVYHPKEVYEHFVKLPADVALYHQQQYADAKAKLDALVAAHAPGADVAAAQTKASTEARALGIAQRAQRERQQMFDLMRNDVFGTDREQKAAVERLRHRGVSDDKLRAFQRDAAQVSTPEELKELEMKV
jgi:hypothetical protein